MLLLNGTPYAPDSPEFPLLNRSFRYGDGLFETIRVFQGQPLFLKDHFARLQRGMDLLGLRYDPEAYPLQLRQHLRRAIEVNRIDHHGRLRLHVYRAGEGAYRPLSDEPHSLIEAYPLAEDTYAQATGLSLGIFPDWELRPTPLSACKTANALPYVMAARYAREQGWDEALLWGSEGLAEASASNLFVVKHRQILTPPLSSGCLPGTMRQVVMRVAQEVRIPMKEKKLGRRDLKQADEVFLTNAIRGIQPVERFEGRKQPWVAWPLTVFLQNSLYQYVQKLM